MSFMKSFGAWQPAGWRLPKKCPVLRAADSGEGGVTYLAISRAGREMPTYLAISRTPPRRAAVAEELDVAVGGAAVTTSAKHL